MTKRDRLLQDPVFMELYPRKMSKGDRRKFAIVQAAIECLAIDGLHHTSFETIGRRLGIGRSHVLYHFPAMDQLLLTTVEYITRTAQKITVDALTRAKDPRAQIIAYVRATFEWAKRHPEQTAVFCLFFYLSSCDEAFRELHSQIRAGAQKRIEAIIASAPVCQGRGKRDPSALSRSIHGLVVGNVINAMHPSRGNPLDQARDETIEETLRMTGFRLSERT